MSSIQRSFNTLQYYTGTQNGVRIIEVSAIQRFVIERLTVVIILLLFRLPVCNAHSIDRYIYNMCSCAQRKMADFNAEN